MCLVLRTSFFTMNGCRKKRLDPLWKELKKIWKGYGLESPVFQ